MYNLNASVSDEIFHEWATSGDGVFGNPGSLTTFYNPGTNDIANGFVTLSLQVVGDIPCNNLVLDTIDLFIVEGTTVFAGADVTLCGTESFYQINDATVAPTNYQDLIWTTSGNGFLMIQLR